MSPSSRPPSPPMTSTSVPEKQEFGTPSKLYYEHRLPLKVSSMKGEVNGVPEIREAIEEAKRFSAVALKDDREVFTVGIDSDEDDEDAIPLSQLIPVCKARQDPPVNDDPSHRRPRVPPRLTPISPSDLASVPHRVIRCGKILAVYA
ncbi:hypothetical protein C8R47DRAFT_1209110 [Mycena vitilis]|nr:hypothetical protein C8R47DRAFT_1209110 [Mycena vitilis]